MTVSRNGGSKPPPDGDVTESMRDSGCKSGKCTIAQKHLPGCDFPRALMVSHSCHTLALASKQTIASRIIDYGWHHRAWFEIHSSVHTRGGFTGSAVDRFPRTIFLGHNFRFRK